MVETNAKYVTKAARATRAEYRHFQPVATRWMDNDMYGHVNNVAYYAYFDTVVNAYLIGEGVLDPAAGDVIGLVVETGCRYFASASYPETLEVGLRVAHLGNSSVRYELGVFRAGEDRAIAEGFFVHVYVDRTSRSPTPLQPPLRDALAALAV